MLVWSFDSETSDLIKDWKLPSDGPNQPHIVSLSGILFDDQTREELDTLDVIIRPDGWESTQEAFDVHGITTDHAMAVGIPEVEALGLFHAMWLRAQMRTAFNTTFDNRMIRIAQKRFWPKDDYYAEQMRIWKEEKHLYFCTMMKTRKLLGGKQPTLEEAYQALFQRQLRVPGQPHSAMQDARAGMEIYLELRRRGVEA